MILQSSVKAYEHDTHEIINRFLAHELNFPDCIAALDAALADFIPRMEEGQLLRLRIVMLANNEIVMKEMARREPLGFSTRI